MPAPARSPARVLFPILLAACLAAALTILARPAAASSRSNDSIRVHLDGGRVLEVASVRYATIGMLLVIDSKGVGSYVPTYRVRSIEDAAGNDRTRYVIDQRGRIGADFDPNEYANLSSPGPPPREARKFALTEVGYLHPLHSVDATHGDREASVILDFGTMWNRSRDAAVGLAAHADIGSYRLRFGPVLRLRRWVSDDVAFDYGIGVLPIGSEDDHDFDFHGPAVLGQVGVTLRDAVAIEAQAETRAVRYTGPATLAPGRSDQHGIDVRVGAKAVGLPGKVATLGLFLVAVGFIIVLQGPTQIL